ncbi:MAG: tetratricopeptide repeat protein [Bacillota bacterium]
MKFCLALAAVLSLSGCSSLFVRSDDGALQNQKLQEERELQAADNLNAQGQLAGAQKLYQEFQKRYPQSVYFQASRLGEALALQGQGKWVEAVAIERDVYLKTKNLQPDIAALAQYRMSFAYEALGDDQKTVASLLDAKNLGNALPKEVAWAEIPARLASVYSRLGQEKEAVQYLNEAEKGITKIREEESTIPLRKGWLAKTYVQMGTASTNQLSVDNFESFVNGQKLVQVYLIKAMELDDAVWSPQALKQLKGTYQDLSVQVEAVRSNRSQLEQLGGAFVELINRAELYRPLAGQSKNSYQIEFFDLLANIKTKTEKLLYQGQESMGLTEESQKLNSLKRAGRVKVEELLPEEKASKTKEVPNPVPSEDPNL